MGVLSAESAQDRTVCGACSLWVYALIGIAFGFQPEDAKSRNGSGAAGLPQPPPIFGRITPRWERQAYAANVLSTCGRRCLLLTNVLANCVQGVAERLGLLLSDSMNLFHDWIAPHDVTAPPRVRVGYKLWAARILLIYRLTRSLDA